MPWIESHTTSIEHKKFRESARELNIKQVLMLGHMTAFWHKVMELAEDGIINCWNPEDIAYYARWEGDPVEFFNALKDRFIDVDEKGQKVHDWLDYGGLFLIRKYSTNNPARLKKIWKRYGKVYGGKNKKPIDTRGKQETLTVLLSEQLLLSLGKQIASLPNLPNLTNLPNQPTYGDLFEWFWKVYICKDGKKIAERHFGATVTKDQDALDISIALSKYLTHLSLDKNKFKNPKAGSTWFNNWRDWVHWVEPSGGTPGPGTSPTQQTTKGDKYGDKVK